MIVVTFFKCGKQNFKKQLWKISSEFSVLKLIPIGWFLTEPFKKYEVDVLGGGRHCRLECTMAPDGEYCAGQTCTGMKITPIPTHTHPVSTTSSPAPTKINSIPARVLSNSRPFQHINCLIHNITYINTHTHTHPFNDPLSRTTQVSRYRRGKTNVDFTEARDSEWQWHQLGYMQLWCI